MWRTGSAVAAVTLLATSLVGCWSAAGDATGGVVIVTPAPTRTVAPFLAGERPLFPTETPMPTSTLEPTVTPEPTVEAVAAGSEDSEGEGPVETTGGASGEAAVESTSTPEPCAVGEIGETGIAVVSESFYGAAEVKVPGFRPGLESDFYSAHNPRWLIWLLEFDIPAEVPAVDIGYRWGQVLEGGERHVMLSRVWDPLESGGDEMRITGMGGESPGFWLPGRYFVDAWSPQHECEVASWYFEVH